MFAVVKTGAKQYVVEEGSKIKVEKLPGKEGGKTTLKEVLLISDEKADTFHLGDPLVKGAKVEAKIVSQGRFPKVTIIKHKRKKRYKLKKRP